MDQEEPNNSLEEKKRSPFQNYTLHLRSARLVIIAAPYFDQGSLYSPEASPTGLVLKRSHHSYLGTPEKVRSTAAQLVSVIESR